MGNDAGVAPGGGAIYRLGSRLVASVLALALGAGAACTSETPDRPDGSLPAQPSATPSVEPTWPTEGWPRVAPEGEGFDSVGLAEALEDVASMPVHSVLVVRNGSVLLDAYGNPYDGSIPHDLASVTKSVTSTLVGIAANEGLLDLDAPMVSFFPDREIANLDEVKERITVRHLLAMSSGLDCTDALDEITLREMWGSPDWTQFVLDLPVVAEPGTTFAYCSPGMHLLSAILERSTGMSALAFAREHLFGPLGIEDVYWPADPQGVTHGWGDLALHPLDAAKLGYLYLHEGRWDGRQILSPEWVAEATRLQTSTGRADDYGYGWWVSGPEDETAFFRADGREGQRILVVPSWDMIVVTTGGGLSFELLIPGIAEALAPDGGPLPANPAGADRLAEVMAELARPPEPEPVPPLPEIARDVSGRTYVFEPGSDFGLRSVRLDFDDPAEAVLALDLAGELEPRVDRVGLDGVFRPSLEGRPIVARGSWDGPRTFVVECDEGPGLERYDLRLTFTGRAVRLEVLGTTVVGLAASSED